MSKYREVYNDIKEKINNGQLQTGNFLESEYEVANKY